MAKAKGKGARTRKIKKVQLKDLKPKKSPKGGAIQTRLWSRFGAISGM